MKEMNVVLDWKARTQPSFDLRAFAKAAQKRYDNHFTPAWQVKVNLFVLDDDSDDYHVCSVLDDADQAGALGYHVKTPSGFARGMAFVRTVQRAGQNLGVTIIHEVDELVVDPSADQTVKNPANGWGYAFETDDAVQGEDYGYLGFQFPNFVYPDWFNAAAKPGTKLDYRGSRRQPFQIGVMGYMPVYQPGVGWTQIFGSRESEARYNLFEHSRVPLIVARTPLSDDEYAALPTVDKTAYAGCLS